MATKKAATASAAMPEPGAKADADLVQDAYEDALKKSLGLFFDACIDNHQQAEERFTAGLKILREARKRAVELMKQ